MSVTLEDSAVVGTGGETIALSSLFSVTASSSNPAYLILSAVDIDEYSAKSSDATGLFTGGDGTVLPTKALSSDDTQRVTELVFTYQASSGRYYNATYGYLDQMTYTLSSSADDLVDISLFATNSSMVASRSALDPASLSSSDASGFIGSATIYTGTTGSVIVNQSNTTPDSIATAAAAFVGKIWNLDGCWNEADAIAAEAGVGLPVSAAYTTLPGTEMGEWTVVFDGRSGDRSLNWVSLVQKGDIVCLVDNGTGHITTVAAGSGSSALLVDDVVYEASNGSIVNAADDGNADDIVITPILASSEFSGVSGTTVIIYRLDLPTVSNLVTAATVAPSASLALSSLFSATSPDSHAITEWQIYDVATGNSFSVNGATESAHSAATAITVSSLSGVSLVAGTATGTDTIEVRAYNGTYWGDWQGLDVYVGASALPTNASTDAAIVAFIATQNESGRGSDGVGLLNDGIVSSGDSVIGEMSASLGSGVNAVVLDNDVSAYSWQVDNSGTLKLTDQETGKSYTVTGASEIIFDSALQDSSGDYVDILFVLNKADSAVARYYEAAFGRVPDLAGMEYWIGKVASGVSLADTAQYFLASPEFAERYGGTTISDDSFVTLLYQNVLDRTPSSAELSFYEAELSAGVSRSTIFTYFASSEEFVEKLSASDGGWLIDTSLGGSASSDDLFTVQTAIAQGATDSYLDAGLISASSVYSAGTYTSGGLTATALSKTTFSITDSGLSGLTLLMASDTPQAIVSASHVTVYTASAGGDIVTFQGSGSGEMVVMAGSADKVAFAAGSTAAVTVAGFIQGSDHVDLTAFQFASYAALEAAATITSGASTVIALQNGPTITLSGIAGVTAGDFLLS